MRYRVLLATMTFGVACRSRVDVTHSGDRNGLNSIDPVGADAQLGISPTTGQ
jgi:hypothetical protein